MTGALLLYGEPSASNEATTKNYVDTSVNTLKAYTDTQLATKLNLAGGVLTGSLTLASDPTANLEAATKQYVDVSVATHANDFSIHLTSTQNELLDNLDVSATEIN